MLIWKLLSQPSASSPNLRNYFKGHKPPAALQYFKYVETETVPVFLSSAFMRMSKKVEKRIVLIY
jgi:predicted transcriptional regulator